MKFVAKKVLNGWWSSDKYRNEVLASRSSHKKAKLNQQYITNTTVKKRILSVLLMPSFYDKILSIVVTKDHVCIQTCLSVWTECNYDAILKLVNAS